MINQWIAYILIFIGCIFEFLGILGLIRLPDIYTRLQASAKCVTFGSVLILLGVFVYFGWNPTGIKALLTMGFILLTAPVSAHTIARAAHRKGIPLAKGSTIDQYASDLPLKEE